MAKQIGLVQLEGTVGNVSFYSTKNGNFARQKPASKAISSERTKENMSEFARAASAGKLVRTAFSTIISDMKDSELASRLARQMYAVQATDTLSPRGMRNVPDGDIEILQGFELNSDKALSTVLKVQVTPSIDRATGAMQVTIPEFNPSKLIEYPEGTTHYKFRIAGAMINFRNQDHLTAMAESETLLLANAINPAVELDVQVPVVDGNNALMLALGISFFQERNSFYYTLGEKMHNAIAFVAVAGPAV